MSLKFEIWALRLGFGPQVWDLDLKARIGALRLGSESEGGYGRRRRRRSRTRKFPIYVKAQVINSFGAAALKREREQERENSCKSVRWSAVPVPCLSRLWL